MNFLGIDFGLKKIGLAWSEGKLAEPLKVVDDSPKALEFIKTFCREHEVTGIIIGLPSGGLRKQAREYGSRLAVKLSLPVIYQDETLTSRDAVAKMISSGRGQKFRREKEDAVAAAIILQNYLEDHV